MVDEHEGSIVGMIVATTTDAQERYFVPAKDIFSDIKTRWPTGTDIKLPTQGSSFGAATPARQMPVDTGWLAVAMQLQEQIMLRKRTFDMELTDFRDSHREDRGAAIAVDNLVSFYLDHGRDAEAHDVADSATTDSAGKS